VNETRRGPWRRGSAALIVVGLIASACSGGDDEVASSSEPSSAAPNPAPSSSVVTTTVPTASTVPPAVTTSPPVTVAPTTAAPVATDGAVAVWQQALTAALGGGGDVATLASPDAGDALASLTAFGSAPLTFFTLPTANADGSVAIEECVLATGSETGAFLLRAVVTDVVVSVDVDDAIAGCVPAEVNTAVLNAYRDFWAAFDTFTRPPDPASPLLTEVMASDYLEAIQAFVERLSDEGKEFRGSFESRPEVEAYQSATRVTIGDCQVMSADFGVFVVGTDERTEDWPTPREGQTDFRSVTMDLIDGTWKVVGLTDETDSPCPYPSPRAVGVVGGGA
jgi:hypothetical protein